MKILHKILLACVKQLQERGGVLHEDAAYWIKSLEKEQEMVAALEDRIAGLESLVSELSDKVEYLGELTGAASGAEIETADTLPVAETPEDVAAEDEPYEDEDPRYG